MRFASLLLTALTLALAACEGGGDPVQQALRDASAKRQAEAVTIYDEGVDLGEGSQRPSATPDDAYVQAMILRHREATDAARKALTRTTDPEIRRMAEATIESRSREIAELQAWVSANASAE